MAWRAWPVILIVVAGCTHAAEGPQGQAMASAGPPTPAPPAANATDAMPDAMSDEPPATSPSVALPWTGTALHLRHEQDEGPLVARLVIDMAAGATCDIASESMGLAPSRGYSVWFAREGVARDGDGTVSMSTASILRDDWPAYAAAGPADTRTAAEPTTEVDLLHNPAEAQQYVGELRLWWFIAEATRGAVDGLPASAAAVSMTCDQNVTVKEFRTGTGWVRPASHLDGTVAHAAPAPLPDGNLASVAWDGLLEGDACGLIVRGLAQQGTTRAVVTGPESVEESGPLWSLLHAQGCGQYSLELTSARAGKSMAVATYALGPPHDTVIVDAAPVALRPF